MNVNLFLNLQMMYVHIKYLANFNVYLFLLFIFCKNGFKYIEFTVVA